ncbi:DNA repair protein RadA [Spirochaetia bacterium 38H-sp]|uniref:DNA repair protein RadA n=1 Tax=Rarispira pelagica TaxID=3141764 RepID=A0ABU9UBH5_9SPIR
MSAKKTASVYYTCSECGASSPKWLGKCPDCGTWNSMIENQSPAPASYDKKKHIHKSELITIDNIPLEEQGRISTGISELDRVLGGGMVPGSSILIGGEPGIGKSTLMLQAASKISQQHKTTYIAGEESPGQIASRAKRIGAISGKLTLTTQTTVEELEQVLRKHKTRILVVDSIQMLHSPQAGNTPGTINQLKYCTYELSQWAKENNCIAFFIAHLTKEGSIAGPRQVEHMVDTVLYFENTEHNLRILRSSKNRFGSIDELGIFSMSAGGLEEVREISNLFLVNRAGELPPGVAVAPVEEGTRTFLVEIQALTVPSKTGLSRVYSGSIDPRQVSRVAAVLEKHIGLQFSSQDIYVNIAGGLRIKEVAIELPLAMALYSARTGINLPQSLAITGELSLAGEVRSIKNLSRRIKTARELGIKNIISPPAEQEKIAENFTPVRTIKEAISTIFGNKNN